MVCHLNKRMHMIYILVRIGIMCKDGIILAQIGIITLRKYACQNIFIWRTTFIFKFISVLESLRNRINKNVHLINLRLLLMPTSTEGWRLSWLSWYWRLLRGKDFGLLNWSFSQIFQPGASVTFPLLSCPGRWDVVVITSRVSLCARNNRAFFIVDIVVGEVS